MRITFIFLLSLFGAISTTEAQIPTQEQQIKAAVLAAPDQLRSDAKVMGYNQSGELITLKQGTNNIICISDDPSDEKFQVVCYHKSMDPYMARGRELRRQGVDNARQIREKEATDGTLKMPEQAAAFYSLNGGPDAYNYETGTLQEAKGLYVLYMPFATVESTGFPTSPPVSGGPWLMREGQPSAHVMMPLPTSVGVKVDSD